MDEEQLIARLRTTPPSCLNGFEVAPAQFPKPFDNNPCSVWQLSCRCGCLRGKFLGYPLKNYNAGYVGAECFLSPLAFECAACTAITEILDTDRHGYHAEVSRREGDNIGSGKLRGEGPRHSFSCPGCGAPEFTLTLGFVFWYPDELAEEFDDAWEDLFSVFLCHCQCANCAQISQPTDFGKL